MLKSKKAYFELTSSDKVNLSKYPTDISKQYTDFKYHIHLAHAHLLIEEYQELLYANHTRSLLLIFQGVDTAGKDSAIKHVMSGVNPQGCSVVSFKTPSSQELEHDFLWRATCALPARGQIGIFNRSYYEETLITRVHPELIAKERLPVGKKLNEHFWENRYRDICHYEKYLHHQGYEIVKIFLHLSKGEQKRRLLERFDNPKKQWKIDVSDLRERAEWGQYQNTYGECISQTATETSPWYLVPADDKKIARLSISRILVKRFEEMNLELPKMSREKIEKYKRMRKSLIAD